MTPPPLGETTRTPEFIRRKIPVKYEKQRISPAALHRISCSRVGALSSVALFRCIFSFGTFFGFIRVYTVVFSDPNCIIYHLRNSSKYVSYKDIKALMADLKRVYQAVDEQSALAALDDFAEIWDKKYPKISKSWRENWANLSTYFKFPEELRRLIYTTNAIEGFNRQLRKVTKSKAVFLTDDSLFKMLYLAMLDITKKWTERRAETAVSVPGFALRFNSSSY